jgi:molecular chaperone GrpE (heat shock protein)
MPDFFHKRPSGAEETPGAARERILELEREVQSLRLALDEKEAAARQLRGDLETLRAAQHYALKEQLDASLEKLVAEAAGPAAQLVTQAYLLEAQGKPVQPADILAVARRLLRALENAGLQVEGQVGQAAAFDPERHAGLSAQQSLAAGETVRIRFAGVRYRGKMIRKAAVEKEA